MIGNILGMAMKVIPTQTALLFRWIGREANDRGLEMDVFAPPVTVTGSIQPVDRSRYGYFGLEASKGYITVYSGDLIQDLTRTANPDQLEYGGRRYRVLSRADWHSPADYNGLMAVDIGPATGGA